jgi:4a-hydroxytetrahydrobiopterin dehydratase
LECVFFSISASSKLYKCVEIGDKNTNDLYKQSSNPIEEKYMNQAYHLSQKTCQPCKEDVPPLKGDALSKLQQQLKKGWQIVNEHHLEKEYQFPDFKQALAFTNRVGELAEKEGHHPDIYLTYGKVKITLWTHKIDGLTENDFILAAKCDEL